MNAQHQGDLVWRFQHADEAIAALPSALAVLAAACERASIHEVEADGEASVERRVLASERARLIDAKLARLSTKPIPLAGVLALRYGLAESPRETERVLRELAAVAVVTPAGASEFERALGRPPGAGSHDVRDWLAEVCGRILARKASAEDAVALNEVRREAEALVAEAEGAYEALCAGTPPSNVRRKTTQPAKAFYTVPELARAFGVSRWTVRRWLDEKGVPYEMHRRTGGTRGGRIVVLVSELRTYAPTYFASMHAGLGEAGE